MKNFAPTSGIGTVPPGDAPSDALDPEGAGEIGIGAEAIPIRRLSLRAALLETWRERRLFLNLLGKVFSLRMPRTVLGVWWFPIIILFNTLGATFIFGAVLGVGTGSGIPYFLFACAGSTAWFLFYRGAIFSMRSFHRFRHYVTVFSLPLLLVPFAGVAMATVFVAFHVIFLFGSFAVFWALDGELYLHLGPQLLLLPVALLWMGLLAAVIGLWSGVVYWRARDVRQMFRLVLPFLMFVTPILYPLATLEATAGEVVNFNPLAAPVELLRAAVFGTDAPSLHVLSVTAGITVALVLGGCWFTNRFGYTFLGWRDEDADDDDEM